MDQFVWITGSGTFLFEAKDQDEAYRRVLANRMAAGQTVEEAVSWFEREDQLHPVDGSLEDPPYAEIPDSDPYDV